MNNTPYDSDINKLFVSKNEATTDLNKAVQKLRALKSLKSQIETDKLTEKDQYEIDALSLITFENLELEKLRKEILNIYNTKEQNSRIFLGYEYATVQDRNKAEKEYIEIEKLKNIAKNTFDINGRKEILNKINNMTFSNKNISSQLYEIDTICRTYNGNIYDNITELEKGLSEKDKLPEFIKINELLNEHLEISAFINIKKEFNEIKKFNFSNLDIKNCITETSAKLDSLENNLKTINGKHYSSLEEIEKIQNELYYIDNESYKFDMNTKSGLSLFLELMSFRDFTSIEAREKIQAYQAQYAKLDDDFIKENIILQPIETHKKTNYSTNSKYKFAIYGLKFSLLLFLIAFLISIVNSNLGADIGTASVFLAAASFYLKVYYKKKYNNS